MSDFNRLVLDTNFHKTLNELKNSKIHSPFIGTKSDLTLKFPDGVLLNTKEEIGRYQLDAKDGRDLFKKYIFSAYDESFVKFDALEGVCYFTSHSMLLLQNEYSSANYLTFNFYTKSKEISEKSEYIKYLGANYNLPAVDMMKDKINFLLDNTPDLSTILLIDGPLIAGDAYTYMMSAQKKFDDKGVIPIYFVKNSNSNLVTDNIVEWAGKFNSDMHWCYNYLKPGERTNFFFYRDKNSARNSKAFCYLKTFDLSPQRIEVSIDVYEKYRDLIESLMNVIYYLIIVQGDKKNPQVRPIAVAEKYARETLKLINPYRMLKKTGVKPIMNEIRFGGFNE